MSQASLFDNLPPASRRTDPTTSHEAEQSVNGGARQKQMHVLAALVREHPDQTGNELSAHGILTERQISRRLNDAHTNGLIYVSGRKRCSISGRTARAWRAA
jgi:hypothetical protein